MIDELKLSTNDGSLDREVDGRAVGTLLCADEGVGDGLVLGEKYG